MRLQHIDIARGVCILMVVLGHNTVLVDPDSAFNGLLGAFRMPLMFFIAGTFFAPDQPFGELLWRKADALIKPFLVMAVLHAPLRMLWWQADPSAYVLGVLSGSGTYLPWLYALWFLPHLWLLFACAWGFNRLADRWSLSRLERMLVLGLFMMAGHQLLPMFWMHAITIGGHTLELKGLPLSADLLPLTLFFFFAGVMLRQPVRELPLRWPGLLLSVAALVTIFCLYEPRISLFSRQYTHMMASTAMAFAGIGSVLHLSVVLTRVPRLARGLAHCGYNSLFILLFHSPIQQATGKGLLLWLGPDLAWLAGGIGWAVAVAGSLWLARTIRQRAWLRLLFLPLPKGRARPATAEAPARLDAGSDDPARARRAA